MGVLADRLRAFSTNRWLVFVAAMWLQSMAGIGYLFGAISPILKAALGYNQRHVAALGIAKDLGDCVGFLAGSLSAMLPAWAMLLIGALQNFLGYGWLWLIVTKQAPPLPLSMVNVCPYFCWNQRRDIFQHNFTGYMHPEFPKEQGPNCGHSERICWA
ncbi:unnamed protein product [Triticum turgidum subsp. durum]|uniref:Nodulin-like domain-containing protein n=1 Tax=Triticum turgidum subsp. durum TaxID=4567 RepID=A0A9R1NVP7_TRITD|nr:unnamed protein product [Triticum turgidum subsp. durum]